jgi:putative NIF3 family GTP cyclohydrolase 1 type 2
MPLPAVSRRHFAGLAAAGLLPPRATAQGMTARQVIERIQQNVGVPWAQQTVDTFKAGNPDTAVKGIATTMMATLDLLQRAAGAGRNLVITHEPTFYSHEDNIKDLAGDPVFEDKMAFIRKNDLVVWRFHDHWHRHAGDGILTGMAAALGWQDFRPASASGGRNNVFTVPKTSLEALAASMAGKLKIRAVRVIGDPKLPVARIALSPGFASPAVPRQMLTRPDVDVVAIGEAREWEVIEYAQDVIASGRKKGLIVLGHVVSEEAGMQECARWLKTFITGVPIDFIPAGEPFWRPAA